jgi:uncharacterized protein (TIGR03435 family)
MALPIVTTMMRYDRGDDHHPASVTAPRFSLIGQGDTQRVADVNLRRQPSWSLATLQPWILPMWSFGVVLLSLRLVAGGIAVRALRRSVCRVDDVLRQRVADLARRMAIRRHVELVTSIRSESPGVIGWLRPLILLPPATLIGLTTIQLDAVLAHELAHVRRHDYAVNIVQMIAETLLFYHPAVWWVSKQLRTERELCCDDEAVRVCGDRAAYARALVTMARLQNPSLAIGANGGSLRDRVHRLLGLPAEAGSAKVGAGRHETRRPAASSLSVIVVTIVSIAFVHVGAQNERPRFEVASIKPAVEGRGFAGPIVYPGGVVRTQRIPLFFLIAIAYDVPWQRVDGPSGVINEQYAIEAKADASSLPKSGSTIQQTMRAEMRLVREMLKTLLADRFKLAIHVEKRETPIYALVVNGGKPKIRPAARSCEPTTMAEYESGRGPCGLRGGGPANGYHAPDSALADLAAGLSNFLERPIIDRTGIEGRFDIDVPPWSTGAPPRPDSDEPQPDPNGPSIFAVLQQMGLRLEPSRAPIDHYVVDHVERPSEN